jgi:hypothetical protein
MVKTLYALEISRDKDKDVCTYVSDFPFQLCLALMDH